MQQALYKKPENIQGFQQTQAIARDACLRTFAILEEGVSEKEVVAQMRADLHQQGVRSWLHVPFVWFGERTAFKDFKYYWHFLPTKRQLKKGEAVILDVAPVVDGFPADYAHSGIFGESEIWQAMHRYVQSFILF